MKRFRLAIKRDGRIGVADTLKKKAYPLSSENFPARDCSVISQCVELAKVFNAEPKEANDYFPEELNKNWNVAEK